jgi:triacylglycerol esterase/lipase EstA (alpha/beta hydrolase family)
MPTFILVHGTFATEANWPSLEQAIKSIPFNAGEEAFFKRVTWSGKNRAAARQSAASAIGQVVQDVDTQRPGEKVFLIGHSHGGSAIAYFLKSARYSRTNVVGCAFLSTPFVAMRRRRHATRILVAAAYYF